MTLCPYERTSGEISICAVCATFLVAKKRVRRNPKTHTRKGICYMADAADSTTDTSRYSDGERQGLVNLYVTLMLRMIQEDPWISVPDHTDFLI